MSQPAYQMEFECLPLTVPLEVLRKLRVLAGVRGLTTMEFAVEVLTFEADRAYDSTVQAIARHGYSSAPPPVNLFSADTVE